MCSYVLPNLHVRLSLLPNLYVRSYVRLYVLPNLYGHSHVIPKKGSATPLYPTPRTPSSLTWVPQSRLAFGHHRRVRWPRAFGLSQSYMTPALLAAATIACSNQESFLKRKLLRALNFLGCFDMSVGRAHKSTTFESVSSNLVIHF